MNSGSRSNRNKKRFSKRLKAHQLLSTEELKEEVSQRAYNLLCFLDGLSIPDQQELYLDERILSLRVITYDLSFNPSLH